MAGAFSVAGVTRAENIIQPGLAIIRLPDLVIESANDAFLSVIAKTSAEVIGKPATQSFVAPGFPQLLEVLKSSQPIGNRSLQISDASNQFIQFTFGELRDESNGTERISIVAVRVSDHAFAELSKENKKLTQQNDELRSNIKHLMAITMASADVVYKMDADWSRMLELSASDFLASTGKPDHEWLGRYILPADQPRVLTAIKHAIDGKHMFELEHRVIKANGDEGWTHSKAIAVEDEHGNITGWLGMTMDITGRKKAEQKLLKIIEDAEQQRRMYETITSNTPDLVYVFDLNACFSYANEALLTMWGRTKEDSIGKSLLEVGYEPWHAEMHQREIELIIKTHETVRGEVAFPHATLGKRVYDYILVPVLDARGNVTAIAGTTRDITEIKKLSAQKDEFLGVASHELKTPLTSVKAYGQILQAIFEAKNDPDAVKALQRMDNQVNKLTGLINDLLDVTRIRSGKILFNEEMFDVTTLTLEILDSLQLTTQRHTIKKYLATGVMFLGDKERIGQVITNLVTNAIKYSPAGGDIEVSLYYENDRLLLSVRDFGLGIPKEMQTKVFEQFYRANSQNHAIGGMGIGLYISAEIINRSGGKIWVESVEDVGSTFYVSLPVNQGL